MGVERTYIGARYVPVLYTNSNGTNEWVSGVAYEALTIVSYNGNSYTSKKKVPTNIGNPASNPTYWVLTGSYNSQIDSIEQAISALDSRLDTAEDDIDDLQGDLSTTDTNLASLGADVLTLAGRLTSAEGQLSTVDQRITNGVNAKIMNCSTLNLNQNSVTTQDIIDAMGNGRGLVFVDYFSGSTTIAGEIGTTNYVCVIIWASNTRAGGMACVQSTSGSVTAKVFALNHYAGSPASNLWTALDKKISVASPMTVASEFTSIMSVNRQRGEVEGNFATLSGTVTFPNGDISGEWGDVSANMLPANAVDFAIGGKQGFGRGYITTAGKIGFVYSKVNNDQSATLGFCVTYKIA